MNKPQPISSITTRSTQPVYLNVRVNLLIHGLAKCDKGYVTWWHSNLKGCTRSKLAIMQCDTCQPITRSKRGFPKQYDYSYSSRRVELHGVARSFHHAPLGTQFHDKITISQTINLPQNMYFCTITDPR